jgi:hypothetical protein
MAVTSEQLQLLRALYRNRMGGGASRSSWGQGGAADHRLAMRYADLRSQGFTDEQARSMVGNGGVNGQYGSDPTDPQLLQWAQTVGATDPQISGVLQQMSAQPRPGRSSKGGAQQSASDWSTGDPLLDRYLADVQAKSDLANLTNDQVERNVDDIYRERERQADVELTALRDRVMGRVDNWGKAQEQLNKERAAEALGEQRANLAARGLDMSTRDAAFMARNARDLALAQQDLSERRDARAINYDLQATDNLAKTRAQLAGDRAAFQERPMNQGPDMGQAMQLAMQYGVGNRGNGFLDGSQSPAMFDPGPRVLPNTAPIFQGMPAYVQAFSPLGQRAPQPQPQQFMPQPDMGGFDMGNLLGVIRQQAKRDHLNKTIAQRRAAGYKPIGNGGARASALRAGFNQ